MSVQRSSTFIALPSRKTVTFFDYSEADMELRDRALLAERKRAREQEMLAQHPDFWLPAASEWTEDTLRRLGVKFSPNSEEDLMGELKRRTRFTWTPSHQKLVDEGTVQLEAYDVRKTLESRTRVRFKSQAPDFRTTHEDLQRVIQIKDTSKTEKQKARIPSDSPATDGTGESNESGQETKVNQFAMTFLKDVLAFLDEKFTVVPWSKNRLVFNVYMDAKMNVPLGGQTLKVQNDGYIGFELVTGDQTVIRKQMASIPPIVSLECKRKGHKVHNTDSRQRRRAAQVVAEMLGQLQITEQWLENPGGIVSQEAFVIGCRHDKFIVYYCRFPTEYLKNIRTFGGLYSRNKATKISLAKTKTFRVSNSGPRVEFFEFLARLIVYLGNVGNQAEAVRFLRPGWIDLDAKDNSASEQSSRNAAQDESGQGDSSDLEKGDGTKKRRLE